MRRAVRTLLVVVALGGLLFLFVLPGRTWLQQRDAMASTSHRLQVLNQENQELAKKAAQLQNPDYVGRIARDQYGLVRPGEQSYGILPPTATTTTTTTPVAPAP
ncbi:MAG TPA: septum formation initiator family protein [Acidimicrobiales bacterium]|jgi:cell division protein FtsB|nr:septum formation initiator family protein [Acidimicrobiales bacterium]